MHILQIYKDYYPVLGGIENHVRTLSEGLVRRGHTVTVLATSPTHTTTEEAPLPGLRVVKAARDFHAASTPVSAAMLRLARALRPDVVHLHFPYPPGDLAALAVPGRPPLVVTYHSDVVKQRALLRVYGPLLQHTLGRTARIIATSPQYIAASPWLRRYANTCTVVPLGIDPARFDQPDQTSVAALRARLSPNGLPIVLFVGRLRYYKGLHVLLDALPGVPARFVIAGSGPEHGRLQEQAARLGVSQRATLLGDVADADLPALYHAADMFVLPAHLRSEAFGIVQLEALASGLPCVSTELGTGTSFANLHGETGFVVPPNDPAALARALRVLAEQPALRQQFGANGRRRVRALFSAEQMVAGVEQVYRAVEAERAEVKG